ncbi:MAG: TlpA disulfide reductase family protein [bacterium]
MGETAPDLELPDCDGVMHRIHAACGQPLWIFEFAGWCPPCRQEAAGLQARADAAAARGIQTWMIVSADDGFAAPDAADCRRYRDQYGLTLPVLYDAEGAFQRTWRVPANAVNVVLDAAGVVRFNRQFASDAQVDAALDAL